MSTDTGSSLYEEMHGWFVKVQHDAELAYVNDLAPVVRNRIERDVLAQRARRAARYLAALADRLELFDV